MRLPRPALAALAGGLLLSCAGGDGGLSGATTPGPARSPASTPTAAPTAPVSPPPSGLPPAARDCRAGDPLAGIYHPHRLRLLSPCQAAVGTVLAVIPEPDGDLHIWIAPDPGFEVLLNQYNRFAGQPALVVEISPECPGEPANSAAAAACPTSRLPAPVAGDHIRVTGPLLVDLNHDWQEIHPVNTIARVQERP